MAFNYREGNIDDIEAVFALNRKVFDEAWSKTVMLQSLQVGYDLFVCYQDEDLLGYVLSQDILFETQIMQLAIRQDKRRQGIAQQLMGMLMQTKQDMDELVLEVRASNLGAQAFYKTLGYVAVARRPKYYAKTASKPREDAVVMHYKPQVMCAS
ncbi:ribosomal protein S18-alanine N-acetyltransferase [Ghiorsea bivora]|uniref:ribosomal protein S18-alanine N-acetyltransferase n=1 Tax=Ghiorsea bivora TaxID=1485545 RepID=UPI00056FB58A|nr:ribosomal protein S18-alanine N-acetyltransferase [Ghiorsea bivora]